MEERKKSLRGSVLLVLGAAIWGVAFVAQRAGMDHIGPFTFSALRMASALYAARAFPASSVWTSLIATVPFVKFLSRVRIVTVTGTFL